MKKKVINSDSSKGEEVPKVKERHIVSWSQEEDDILREQIRVHGTENWTIIASKFKDKTTRQCRRRWYTYLNSDFKKGGWSPEEDMLLCEAQKVFGNRWTEIAKVVSGRTDNAVKNRFTTLCKKRAKNEALAKENGATSYINLNNKRIIFPNGLNTDGGAENTAPLKKLRTYIPNTTEENLPRECGVEDQLLRPPFTVLAQNISSSGVDLLSRSHVKEAATFDGSENKKVQGVFLKKDDPKVLALMQQEELLTSLATKVNSDNMDQSLDSAWTVLQDYLKQNKESDLPSSRNSSTDFQLERIDELVEELKTSSEGSRPSWREPDIYAFSPSGSEYSTGSTVRPADKTEECQPEICLPHQETEQTLQPDQLDNEICVAKESGVCHTATLNGGAAVNMLTCNEVKASNGAVSDYSNTEFSSPLHVTPLFRSLAAAIPSPKFSESEKNFLMKTLGMESASSSIITNTSQPPTCKRSLLHCL